MFIYILFVYLYTTYKFFYYFFSVKKTVFPHIYIILNLYTYTFFYYFFFVKKIVFRLILLYIMYTMHTCINVIKLYGLASGSFSVFYLYTCWIYSSMLSRLENAPPGTDDLMIPRTGILRGFFWGNIAFLISIIKYSVLKYCILYKCSVL